MKGSARLADVLMGTLGAEGDDGGQAAADR